MSARSRKLKFSLNIALAGFLLAYSVAGAACKEAKAPTTFDDRQKAILETVVDRRGVACETANAVLNRCNWLDLTIAIAELQLARNADEIADANRLIRSVVQALPQRPGWKGKKTPSSPETSDEVSSVWDFYFVTATLLHRAVAYYGGPDAKVAARLEDQTTAQIRAVFSDWVKSECRIADTTPDAVWDLRGTENHDIQRANACWAGAVILSKAGSNLRYDDGSSPKEQYKAWTEHFIRYVRARALAGASIEAFSPTYSKYYLSVLYNLGDLSPDATLSAQAHQLVTLWWAMWAQEQHGGLHSGGRIRNYPLPLGRTDPVVGMGWLYFPQPGRAPKSLHPAAVPLTVTSFRLPDVVNEMVRRAPTLPPYEVVTHHAGLRGGPNRDDRTPVSPDPVVERYAYVAPDFIMGSVQAPVRPLDDWAPISSQNRWSGLTLFRPEPALVQVIYWPKNNRTTYDALQVTQRRATQILQVQPDPFGSGGRQLQIMVEGTRAITEAGGWIFVENGGFAAARPVNGGYRATADGRYEVVDQTSPVILQAGSATQYASLEAFKAAVLAMSVSQSGGVLSVLPPGESSPILVSLDPWKGPRSTGGLPKPPQIQSSPFIRQAVTSTKIEIGPVGRALSLDFGPDPNKRQ